MAPNIGPRKHMREREFVWEISHELMTGHTYAGARICLGNWSGTYDRADICGSADMVLELVMNI